MNFLKNNKRFSFKLGEINAWELGFKTEIKSSGNKLITVYNFENGLKITNIAKKYDEFGAYEWVNYFENTSDMPSDIISELWDCDCTLPLEHEEEKRWVSFLPDVKTATKIYAPSGSVWDNYEFYCDVDKIHQNSRTYHIAAGEFKEYTNIGGRSSDGNAPFFNIHKNGSGYMLAVGWTGQWRCRISRESESVTLQTKIEDTFFRLMPGEKIRTSSVVIMPYQCDVADSFNKWRRLVKKEFSLIGKPGREQNGPLCCGVWGGMKSSAVLERVEAVKELPFEYIWMDAGWYGINTKPTPDEYEGDWPMHVGDWRVSPLIHPQGLADVSEAIHTSGKKFLLWFEPERVIRTTPIAIEHPEYLLSSNDPNDNNRLLNLGNEEAWRYCFAALSSLIEKLNIDCYRQDFNFQPLEYWRNNDASDRRGITEIKHINGLYKLWDALLDKFPNLLIDNCASGGRRIDIETLRRSIPLWRSDLMCPANYDIEATQCHNLSYNMWIPYSGTSSGRLYDEYRMRSAYAAAMTTNYSFSEREKFCDTSDKVAFIKKYTEEYLKVRPFFSEDFYPLTEVGNRLDTWCAMQFKRPEQGDGLLEVFVRENAPYETACFKLKGIDKNSDYIFTDLDGGEFTVNGEELCEKGLKLTIKQKRKAKLYLYKKRAMNEL